MLITAAQSAISPPLAKEGKYLSGLLEAIHSNGIGQLCLGYSRQSIPMGQVSCVWATRGNPFQWDRSAVSGLLEAIHSNGIGQLCLGYSRQSIPMG